MIVSATTTPFTWHDSTIELRMVTVNATILNMNDINTEHQYPRYKCQRHPHATPTLPPPTFNTNLLYSSSHKKKPTRQHPLRTEPQCYSLQPEITRDHRGWVALQRPRSADTSAWGPSPSPSAAVTSPAVAGRRSRALKSPVDHPRAGCLTVRGQLRRPQGQ